MSEEREEQPTSNEVTYKQNSPIQSQSNRQCQSCGDPLTTIEVELDIKLGDKLNVCIRCINAAIGEIKKEQKLRYYGLDEIDI
jgi:hypothetical protein